MAMFDNAEIMSLPVADVDPDPNGRIGLFFPYKAEALAALIAADGQNDPIKVSLAKGKFPWKLVAGAHRLDACRIAGVEVKAIEVVAGDASLVEIQASENLHRRKLEPIERACFVRAVAEAAKARVAAAHGGKSQQEIAIKARWDKVQFAAPATPSRDLKNDAADTGANLALVYGWVENVGRAMDMSESAIKRDLALYRAIVAPFPLLAKALAKRDNPVPASDLAKLIALDVGMREAVMKRLVEAPGLTVDDVLHSIGARVKAVPATGQTKWQNNFFANWDRFDLSSKRQVLPSLVEKMTPEMKRELHAMLSDELGLAEELGQ